MITGLTTAELRKKNNTRVVIKTWLSSEKTQEKNGLFCAVTLLSSSFNIRKNGNSLRIQMWQEVDVSAGFHSLLTSSTPVTVLEG